MGEHPGELAVVGHFTADSTNDARIRLSPTTQDGPWKFTTISSGEVMDGAMMC